MTEADWRDGSELSLFAVGTTLLRNRWRLARWMAVGAILAALTIIWQLPVYMASASFIPQGNDAARSGLAGIAGQFGVSLPVSNPTSTPEFYTRILTSHVLLESIASDTFVVKELGGRRIPFLDLFKIPRGTMMRRLELGVTQLNKIVSVSVDKGNAIVELSVTTPWRSVSLGIANALVSGVNEYNQRTRQGQAAAERRFVEGRVAMAGTDLRAAEDRSQAFLMKNRLFGGSPELAFERDRLQRDVSLKQQLFTSLTLAYEDARLREVRDTPVITLLEPPSAPTVPQPRGRLKRAFLGLLLGAFVGTLIVLTTAAMDRRRAEGNADASHFIDSLRDVKNEILTPLRWITRRLRPRFRE